MVLHTDEFCPSILLGAELHHCELECPHGTRTNVANLAGFNNVVKRFHCLLDRGVLIEAVNLKEVDVRGIETFERRIHCVEDGLP